MKKTSIEAMIWMLSAFLIASTLGIQFLDSGNWPTGGDSASHLFYAWVYSKKLLFTGQFLPWMPEVFCGFPFLAYYFPMPFVVIALLSKVMGVAKAFKWGAFLASIILPGAIYSCSSRWLKFSFAPSLFAALGALAFLFHEQNSIWGGNLLSTLAGEFAYSYGLLFAVLAMMAWSRAAGRKGAWVTAAVLEAACGFSHGFPLLVVGFSSLLLLLDAPSFSRTLLMQLKGHLLAFCLIGGWLWPMIEFHGFTIPNDAAFGVTGWRDLLPATLWPSLAGGIVGFVMLALPRVRDAWLPEQSRAARLLFGGAGLSAVLFIAGDQLGLADIRFFPPVWLFGAILCGWLAGQVLQALPRASSLLLAMAACLALLGWFGLHVRSVPDWSLWNHSGLDAKPQWRILSRLFPEMRGDLWSPRLVFEHAPENNDIGSTRSLEALPMFLNQRPVLEGLYMESALTGPAVYQVQSEVSEHPSSPLVRYPSGSLDPDMAAEHMNFMHANMLLLRSDAAQKAIEKSGLFEKIGASSPFALYRLKHFDSALIEVVKKPIRIMPLKGWMEDSYIWFRTRSKFEAWQPVYGMDSLPGRASGDYPPVKVISLSRNEMTFETEAVGRPHLIKMAYNPRWHLLSKGKLYLAAPGFMLVVPAEREIRLTFGHTQVGMMGMIASISSFVLLAYLLLRRRKAGMDIAENEKPLLPLYASWLFLALAGGYFGLHSPERMYNLAWDEMRANHYAKAVPLFREAYSLRRPPAKKEEALFWLAKANELAGNRGEAIKRYTELADQFHGYWVPESLYTISHLDTLNGHPEQGAQYRSRLTLEYPNNPWAQKLEQEEAK